MKVETIPIDKIKVVNSRARNPARFREITESIKTLGLKKPIVVRKQKTGEGYDLVCGEGRLQAFIGSGEKEVPAIVVDVSTHDLYLMSLSENIARRNKTTLEDAKQLLALKERGYTQAEIARKVGMTDGQVSALLNLITAGEERLVVAVERGEIPLHVALNIAAADNEGAQSALADAYERGELRGAALNKARRLVEIRRVHGKQLLRERKGQSAKQKAPTRQDFVRTYRRETQRQAIMVKKSQVCETRLLFIASALKRLLANREFIQILRAEKGIAGIIAYTEIVAEIVAATTAEIMPAALARLLESVEKQSETMCRVVEALASSFGPVHPMPAAPVMGGEGMKPDEMMKTVAGVGKLVQDIFKGNNGAGAGGATS